MDDAQRLKKRFAELAAQSERNHCYYFTDFLSPADASLIYELERAVVVGEGAGAIALWGGHEAAERVIARFGDPDDLGYEQAFPIVILSVEPLMEKYAEGLTHRDYLGALMHLGVARDVLGDIYVKDGRAYVFAAERMADYIKDELHRVRHTEVRCRVLSTLPGDCAPRLRESTVILASPRLDGLVAKLYKLSRSEAKALFARQEVFINGRVCANPALLPKDGDIVSVRHHGKWIFRGISRETKKGNEVARIEVYE